MVFKNAIYGNYGKKKRHTIKEKRHVLPSSLRGRHLRNIGTVTEKIDGALPISNHNFAEYAAAGAGAYLCFLSVVDDDINSSTASDYCVSALVPRHFTIKRRRKSWQPKRI